jgi:hypothetical protein
LQKTIKSILYKHIFFNTDNMKLLPYTLIIFWVIIIAFPKIIAYLIWAFFVFLWVNILFINKIFFKNKWWDSGAYVKFGNYKIFR